MIRTVSPGVFSQKTTSRTRSFRECPTRMNPIQILSPISASVCYRIYDSKEPVWRVFSRKESRTRVCWACVVNDSERASLEQDVTVLGLADEALRVLLQ